MKLIRPLLAALFGLILSACSNTGDQQPLKIVTNSWIGYAPLYYAREKGHLAPLGIKLVTVVSLGESLQLYRSGVADAFTGTQYEFSQAYSRDPSLTPIILFDRSNGGDLVMGNRSIEELKGYSGTVDAYLEVDSVNSLMLKDFLASHALQDLDINYINQDQARISTLQAERLEKPTLVVTYFPYNQALQQQGFRELASTRNNPKLLVVDALYTAQPILSSHRAQLQQLKQRIDEAIEVSRRDPKAFYEVVAEFLDNPGYEAFEQGLKDIVWINRNRNPALEHRLREADFPTGDLL